MYARSRNANESLDWNICVKVVLKSVWSGNYNSLLVSTSNYNVLYMYETSSSYIGRASPNE